MIESFVGIGSTVILASIGEHDDRATLFLSLEQIVSGAQDCVIEGGHHFGAQAEGPRRKIAARREVLHLFDLAVKIVNGSDVFLTQAVQETNRRRSTERETRLHAARRVQ